MGMMLPMSLVRYDTNQQKLWIARQRIHHGAVGCVLAATLMKRFPRFAFIAMCWGVTDIRDYRYWFQIDRFEI